MGVDICHVVNNIHDGEYVVDLATQQPKSDLIDSVEIVGWNQRTYFKGAEYVTSNSLNERSKLISKKSYGDLIQFISKSDIVHTHHNLSGFWARIISSKCKVPVVSTEHNVHDRYSLKGQLLNGLSNITVSYVIFVSKCVSDSLLFWENKLYTNNRKVIYNGIHQNRVQSAKNINWSIFNETTVSPDSQILCSAGMLTHQKNHITSIQALEYLNAVHDINAELIISGDGYRENRLLSEVENSKYSNNIHFLGFLENKDKVYKMMSESDVFLLPSKWEGFGVAPLEAMSLGVPCVLSDIDVFHEIYGDSVLYANPNDPSEFGDKIFTLLADTNKYSIYSHKSKSCSDNYPIRKTIEKYNDVYSKVLNNTN